METALRDEIKDQIKNNPKWVETFDTRHLRGLINMNNDILFDAVPARFIAEQGATKNNIQIMLKYFNRFELYRMLRKKRRVKRNDWAEKMLKKIDEKKE